MRSDKWLHLLRRVSGLGCAANELPKGVAVQERYICMLLSGKPVSRDYQPDLLEQLYDDEL